MKLNALYSQRNLLTGGIIYGLGDGLAALLSAELSVTRLIGMAAVGALVYGFEIPHYFRWIDRITNATTRWKKIAIRTLLAILYFNPLWIIRHLAFIHLFSGYELSLSLLGVALQSFYFAIPITIFANLFIQNFISLRKRFMASGLFSFVMAVCYPLIALWFSGAAVQGGGIVT